MPARTRGRGRPSKLTPQLMEKFRIALRGNGTLKSAAKAYRVGYSTVESRLDRGEKHIPACTGMTEWDEQRHRAHVHCHHADHEYLEFLELVEQAKGELALQMGAQLADVRTWNRIAFRETEERGDVRWLFTRRSCMQCTTAPCVWTCPTYALQYDARGFVTVDRERCIGCGRCVANCPFGAPQLGDHEVTDRIAVATGVPKAVSYKCELCADRLDDGLTPACAKTCPPGAIEFGERGAILERARARVAALRASHPEASVYGDDLLGGLHVVEVLTKSPAAHGLPEQPRLGTCKAFDPSTYPDWYVAAVADGRLAAFPAAARKEWYMQPDLVPVARREEPAWPRAAAGPGLGWAPQVLTARAPAGQELGWGLQALMSWAGVGVIGTLSALSWAIRRRMRSATDKDPTGGPDG